MMLRLDPGNVCRRRFAVVLSWLAVGLLVGGMAAGAALAAQKAKKPAKAKLPPPGFVYVGTDEGGTPGMNAIRVFRRDGNGKLAELKSSPVRTGGTGVHPTADLSLANLGPFDSDQSLILDHDRDLLVYPNSGSDTIAVFKVNGNGALGHVKGSPFPSQGVNPVSVGLAKDKVLVVANKDYDLGRPGFNPATRQGNYATFKVAANGRLTPISGGTLPAGPVGGVGPGHPTPTQTLVTRDGSLVFDATFFGLKVRSFELNKGRLTPADEQTIPSPGGTNPLGLAIPLGLQVHPKLPILYVGFVLDNAFGVYTYDHDGALHFQRAIVKTGDGSGGPCWFLVNSAGTRMYVSNNFENTIAVYDLADPLAPRRIQLVTLPQGPNNAAPFQIALDAKDNFLHVVTQRAAAAQDPHTANGLVVLRVAGDGTLATTDFVPLPSDNGSRPQGVAAK
jgi:6-phosphogluconolactonase (cycloisomerase 2 family)